MYRWLTMYLLKSFAMATKIKIDNLIKKNIYIYSVNCVMIFKNS